MANWNSTFKIKIAVWRISGSTSLAGNQRFLECCILFVDLLVYTPSQAHEEPILMGKLRIYRMRKNERNNLKQPLLFYIVIVACV